MRLKIELVIFLSSIILVFSCESPKQEEAYTFEGDGQLVGQWYAKNKDWPHWIEFDSLNNYYRWSFDETKPTEPEASFLVKDTIITLNYPAQLGLDEYQQQFILKTLDDGGFTILPFEGMMATYVYKRDTFIKPTYADIYIFALTKREADSLLRIGRDDLLKYRSSNDTIFADAFYLLEHSWINYHHIDSTFVVTKDGTTYDKFELGGSGVIYFTNDSTYIRSGFPLRDEFQVEIDSFFHFVNRIPNLGN
ncbi:MAG: hypothetical protein ABJG78_13170 [Cyclobacteriaceae bacterium]